MIRIRSMIRSIGILQLSPPSSSWAVFGPRQGMVLFLTRTLCVKYGPLRHLPEASTMEYIAGNRYVLPSAVPKIYCAFHSQRLDIYCYAKSPRRMSCLPYSWKSRSAESQTRILQQLKQMIDGMRSITPPSSAIANVDGGRLWECRLHIPGRSLSFGLFDNQVSTISTSIFEVASSPSPANTRRLSTN